MSKKIINRINLQPKIKEGMEEIASIVKRTLGPGGLPIIIERSGQAQDGTALGPKLLKMEYRWQMSAFLMILKKI